MVVTPNIVEKDIDPKIKSVIEGIRKKYTYSQIFDFVNKLSNLNVLVIGDPIIDEYVYCKTVGTTAKHPAISSIYNNNLSMAGGGLAIARHVSQFAANTAFLGVVGDKNDYSNFIREKLDEYKIKCFLVDNPNSYTVVKRRFISDGYENNTKLFEIAFLNNGLIGEETERRFINTLEKIINDYDLVIVADFGHGMITKKIVSTISEKRKWWSLNVQTNSTNKGFNLVTKYRGANFVCLDELEARLPLGDNYSDVSVILDRISSLIECRNVLLTLGKDGLMIKSDENKQHCPALVRKIVDPVGAGDAVLSLSSLCKFYKLPDDVTCFFSVIMGSLASSIVCNKEPVKKDSFVNFLEVLFK